MPLAFRGNTGPIILEFPPLRDAAAPSNPPPFIDRLGRFLGQLPRDFAYAIELRDRTLLTPGYRSLLLEHGVAHTYNYWSAMPMPAEQAGIIAPEDPPFTVVRLLLKPGTWYEDQREAFRPFNRIVEPDRQHARTGIAIAWRALKRQKRVFILVNNKAEGSSPLTVAALAKRMAERRE